ncbi:hypothetical protein D3Z63_23400 [Vibrio parahaemolyticus]|nr:hypothetical protein RK51_011910 [Vibrio parahaemolyticus]QGG33763.1 hypothetical protein GH799_12055 [Vibrio parahaemolyticus 10329]EGQ8229917.1 hypothetical protein [Vibrio parahaemolyticus]EGQ8237878.1 hypothetical protein [Vibrio parahaemolyticus]EGQ8376441.1 hypothetical protein [Vibrio parahaemolyticus]
MKNRVLYNSVFTLKHSGTHLFTHENLFIFHVFNKRYR